MAQTLAKALRLHLLPISFLLLATMACSLLPGLSPQASPSPGSNATGEVTPTASGPRHTPSPNGSVTPIGSGPAITPPAGAPTQGVPTPTASLSGEVTVQQALAFGPGPFTLSDPKVGLSDLSSYSATLAVSFDGTVNGQSVKWSRMYVMVASKNPAVRQLTIETSGDITDSEAVFMAELDGADYEVRGQNSCTAKAIEAGNTLSDQLEPAGFLSFVAGAEEAGSQTANSVAAKHFTFDERALGQQGLTQSSGELWMAAQGNYLVKYLLTTKATEAYFGDGIAGTLSLDYELTQLGQPVNIQLPAGCPGGMVNAPLLPGASHVVNSPGELSYQTSTSPADAAAFYQTQLAALGWTPIGPTDNSQTEASLDFQQTNQEMAVSITTDTGVTTVSIFLVRAPH